MDRLRQPLFWVAFALAVVVVGMEAGSRSLLERFGSLSGGGDAARAQLVDAGMNEAEQSQFLDSCRDGSDGPPTGLAIPASALLDSLLLYVVGIIGAALIVPERILGRAQSLLGLVVSLLVIFGCLATIFGCLATLILMLGLFLSAPFGTVAYLVLYGSFPATAAQVVLSLAMTCKLGLAGCLVFAHQRFLQNRGLVLLIFTSLLASVVVAFLHGLVPIFLVSITDAVGAIVVAILALIWSILMFVNSIMALIKAIV